MRHMALAVLFLCLLALSGDAGTPWGLDMKEGDNLVFDPSVPGGLKGEPAITPTQPLSDYCTRKGRITFTPQGRIYVCPAGGNSAPVGATTGEGATDYTTLTPGAPATFGNETVYDEAGTGHYQEGPAGDINLLLNTGTAVVIGQESTSTTDRLPLWTFDRDTKALTLLNGATLPKPTDLNIASQAQGDVLYFNGAAWVRLAPGTSGQVLQTNGAGANPTWVNAGVVDKSVRVFHSAAQTLTTSTTTVLAFNSESYDTDGMHDNATNNSRIIFVTAGKYHIVCRANFAANTAGDRSLHIRKNGNTALRLGHATFRATTEFTTGAIVTILDNFAANDYVELEAFQNSGGDLSVSVVATDVSPSCSAQKVN